MIISRGMVSTIIPVYNRSGMIGEAVQSVLDQTYRPIEIILVDDGSTDDTLAELHRLAGEHPATIRVAHRENGGPGLARETGRLLAKGEFMQYLDSDDLLLPRKFEAQVAALRVNPQCGIAYCRTRLIDADGNVLRETSKWTGKKMDYLFPSLLVDRWWHTHTPLYRRELCDRIGPWRKQQPEDWDYDARAGALRARLVFCDEILSCHRDHEGHRVTTWDRERYLPQEWEFLPRLHACATRAYVPAAAPEMRHFSRWAFADARAAGVRKHKDVAKELFNLAVTASGGWHVEFTVYRLLAFFAGWQHSARIVERARSLVRRKPGTNTLKQSWMNG